jgi:folate-binding protein YgfZ
MTEPAPISEAVIYPLPDPGALRIAGPDRVPFLSRQSTNDLSQLAPGRAPITVLTSPTARILDVLRLLPEEEALLALTLPGRGAATARFLKSRIFFMDKVTVEDVSGAYTQIELDGPAAARLLAGLGAPAAPGVDESLAFTWEGGPLAAAGRAGLAGHGFRLLAPAETGDSLYAALQAQGASRLSAEAFHLLRVEAGLPGETAELTEAFTPLETGLQAAVSGSKGCYTGQEVIARQITYDKITQRLAGLRLPGPTEPGARLWAEGKPAGTVTSVAHSPRFGWIALAVVKRPHFEPGSRVALGEAGSPGTAEVTSLPFS